MCIRDSPRCLANPGAQTRSNGDEGVAEAQRFCELERKIALLEKVKHPKEQQEKAPSELFTFLLNKQEAETSARLALEMKVREEQVAAAKNAKEEQAKADMVELAVYRRDALGLALGGDGIGSLGIIQQQQQAALLQQQQQQQQHAGLASGPGINAGMLTQQTNTKAEQQPPM